MTLGVALPRNLFGIPYHVKYPLVFVMTDQFARW